MNSITGRCVFQGDGNMSVILGALVLFPMFFSFSIYMVGRWKKERSYWTSVILAFMFFLLTVIILFDYLRLQNGETGLLLRLGTGSRMYVYQELDAWIPLLNIRFLLGLDGLSLVLSLLTTFIIVLVVLASRLSIPKEHWPNFYMLVFITETGLLGTFLAADLIVFLVFWELVLIPMFFIILFYGHGRHVTSAYMFFIYTHLGGLFLVLGILGAWMEAQLLTGGTASFSFESWAFSVPWEKGSNFLVLFVAFMLFSFLIKLPVFPFHSWLPRAHVDAPTPGSMILAGLLLKMGGYGLIRFGYWFFPNVIVNSWILPLVAILGVTSIVLIAGVALRQDDLKRLVAYSSIVHMSMALLGFLASIVVSSTEALVGSVLMLVAHGVLSPGMFYVVGELQRSHGTRSISWLMRNVNVVQEHVLETILMLVLFLGSMGFPTLAEFVPEFMLLIGIMKWNGFFSFLFLLGAMVMMATFMWAMVRLMYPQASFLLKVEDKISIESPSFIISAAHASSFIQSSTPDQDLFLRWFLALIFMVVAFYLGIFPHVIIGILCF